MQLAAYIQRQKNMILSRHGGIPAGAGAEAFCGAERERLLRELDGLAGLNKRERLSRRPFRTA